MPKRTENCRPKPIRDKRNRLVVYAEKRRVVFGKYDDPVAWEKYNAFCEERQNRGKEAAPLLSVTPVSELPPKKVSNAPVGTTGKLPLIADLVAEFLDYAEEKKDKSDFSKFKTVCNALLRYATLPTEQFDACLLLEVQKEFIEDEADYARTYINKLINFCIHIFKWGEPRRLCPAGKSGQLRAIEPVQYGQARETEDRMPVDGAVVERTLATGKLLPVYQAIIRILQSTGARPIELFRMRIADIDRSDPEIWVYRPRNHKTKRYNRRRIITFGAKEQKVLLPYLEKAPNAFILSPLDEMRELMERGEQTKRRKNEIAEQFDTGKVCIALREAIEAANLELPRDQQIPHWTMYQLRHSYLTKMVEQHGENDAALAGGHSDSKMVRGVYDHSQERRIIQLKRQQEESENTATNGLVGVVRNLDSMGLPLSDIAKATGLAESEVVAMLQEKVRSA